jgi:hypothetical protein
VTFWRGPINTATPPRCYQQDSSADLVAEFVVFSLTDGAGRAETVDAITAVVPAAAMEGCNRTLLLWRWMATAMASAPQNACGATPLTLGARFGA